MAPECANPLLLGWLKEWWDGAREKGSKGTLTYKKAYESMKACPITFTHPSEAQQLHGLGPKLCERLTELLEKHCRDHGLPMPEKPHKAKKRSSTDAAGGDDAPIKKPRKTKEYVPSLRSGPYAILLGLSTLPESSATGMTKTQLIEVAQQHCDSSFTASSDPKGYYTAWNSMKTLVNKELVYESGRPLKKYALTEEGLEVVKRIQAARGLGRAEPSTVAKTVEPAASISPPSCIESADQTLAQPTRTKASGNFQAQIQGFRPPSTHLAGPIDIISLDDEDGNDGNVLDLPQLPQGPMNVHLKRTSGLTRSASDMPASASAHRRPLSTIGRLPSAPPDMHSSPSTSPKRCRPAPAVSFTPIVIPAGTFTVELLLDTREVRSKTDREYIQNGLIDLGVNVDTQALPLGDVLWVARLKATHTDLLSAGGEEGSPRDILLSHIMERKRLDDLIMSIKDGRFHEQKFRLRRSGIPNVTYIVEDCKLSDDTPQRTHDMVNSAIAGTMTLSDFFVKRTRKIDDSIAYIARMTKFLRQRFEKMDLHVIPSEALGDSIDVPRMRSLLKDEKHFLTFDAFSALSGKSDALTLRDVFLKMLMCTRGISGDKAMEIQRRWRTPRELVEAFEKEEIAGGKTQREAMISRAAGKLVGRKAIKDALSRKVADYWGKA